MPPHVALGRVVHSSRLLEETLVSLLVLMLIATPALRAAVTLSGAAGATCVVLAGVRRTGAPRAVGAVPRAPSQPALALDAGRRASRRRRTLATGGWSVDPRAPDDGASRHELAGRGDLNVAACGAFLDALEELTRATWLEIGRRAVDARHDPDEELTAAAEALDAAIVARHAAVTAWLVRDAVVTALETACARASEASGRGTRPPSPGPAETLRLRAARVAAERAALAHLVRPWLPRAHHDTLTGAFALVALRQPP